MGSNLVLTFLVVVVILGLFINNVRPWFLTSGCIGIFVAMAVRVLQAFGICVNPKLVFVLWFPAFLGLAEPSTVGAEAQTQAIHFLGNFLLYAVVGTVIGLGVEGHRRSRQRPHIDPPATI